MGHIGSSLLVCLNFCLWSFILLWVTTFPPALDDLGLFTIVLLSSFLIAHSGFCRKVTHTILAELPKLDPDARVASLELTKDFRVDRLIETSKSAISGIPPALELFPAPAEQLTMSPPNRPRDT